MGDYAFERCTVFDARCDQQRTLEPATVLIGAFKVNIGGPFSAVKNGEIRRAGIEPNVENVVFLAPFSGSAGTLGAGGEQFFGSVLEPGVGAFFFEPFQNIAQRGEIFEAFAASVAVETR